MSNLHHYAEDLSMIHSQIDKTNLQTCMISLTFKFITNLRSSGFRQHWAGCQLTFLCLYQYFMVW